MDRKGFFAGSMTPLEPQTWLEERVSFLPETDEVFYANLNDNRKSRGGYIDDKEIDLICACFTNHLGIIRGGVNEIEKKSLEKRSTIYTWISELSRFPTSQLCVGCMNVSTILSRHCLGTRK